MYGFPGIQYIRSLFSKQWDPPNSTLNHSPSTPCLVYCFPGWQYIKGPFQYATNNTLNSLLGAPQHSLFNVLLSLSWIGGLMYGFPGKQYIKQGGQRRPFSVLFSRLAVH